MSHYLATVQVILDPRSDEEWATLSVTVEDTFAGEQVFCEVKQVPYRLLDGVFVNPRWQDHLDDMLSRFNEQLTLFP